MDARENLFVQLTKKMKSDDWEIRLSTIKEIAMIKDEDCLSFLISALSDDNEEVRSVAALSLGDIYNEEAITALIDLFQRRGKDIVFAYSALTKIGLPALIPLITKLDHEDVLVRFWTVRILHGIGDKRVVEPILAHLEDANADVRIAVIQALGALGDRSILPQLRWLQENDIGEAVWDGEKVKDFAAAAIAKILSNYQTEE